MMKKCLICGVYTLEAKCPKCGKTSTSPHPHKFSPEDKYGKYRRLMMKTAGVLK